MDQSILSRFSTRPKAKSPPVARINVDLAGSMKTQQARESRIDAEEPSMEKVIEQPKNLARFVDLTKDVIPDLSKPVNKDELRAFALYAAHIKQPNVVLDERKVLFKKDTPVPQDEITDGVTDEETDDDTDVGAVERKEQDKVVEPSTAPAKRMITIRRVPPARARRSRRIKDIQFTTGMEYGDVLLNGRKMSERIHAPKPSPIFSSPFYLENREKFIETLVKLFGPSVEAIKDEATQEVSCKTRKSGPFSPLPHQQIVMDYINSYTPYRGAVFIHGLGSGKTCSSIGVAEGLKTDRKVMIMTPASLKMNYREQLKYCGDDMYKRRQFWEWIALPESGSSRDDTINALSSSLGLDHTFIRRNGGAWMVDKKVVEPNYDELSPTNKDAINKQIDRMIDAKYRFISYNGYRDSHYERDSASGNMFDNTVIIIDEAHNFVSRIVNKMRQKKRDALFIKLYHDIMNAENARVILLTGTPVINYPNEIGILFNMIRGYIKTWKLSVLNTDGKATKAKMSEILSAIPLVDYFEYNSGKKELQVTQNPYGFIKQNDGAGRYNGVVMDDSGKVSSKEFISLVVQELKRNGINVGGRDVMKGPVLNKALPDDFDSFSSMFFNKSGTNMQNTNLFQRRILGLVSHFQSAQEELLPSYEEDTNYHVVKIPMSDYQFGEYANVRIQEIKQEKAQSTRKKKEHGKDIYEAVNSTYRIFSRVACNFTFPKDIPRPTPMKKTKKEDAGGAAAGPAATIVKEIKEDIADEVVDDITDVAPEVAPEALDEAEIEYSEKITQALDMMKSRSSEFLSKENLPTYSPKFATIIDTISSEDNVGIHLVYSQFRTLEGIGLLKLSLEEDGFKEFKVRRNRAMARWELDMDIEELKAHRGRMFALYTGTEDPEEKEVIRNIVNGEWNQVGEYLADQLREASPDNNLGEIIKTLMITASGSEGIDLKNVRFVHIMEPYWHPVRVDQVIGRARRICSHQALPKELQTVDAFIYLMTFSEKQLEDIKGSTYIAIRKKDKSREPVKMKTDDGKTKQMYPFQTTDEALNELSMIKKRFNTMLISSAKGASIDCIAHNTNAKKKKACYVFHNTDGDVFSTVPNVKDEPNDKIRKLNVEQKKIKLRKFKLKGIEYLLQVGTENIIDKATGMIVSTLDDVLAKNNVVGDAAIKTKQKLKKTVKRRPVKPTASKGTRKRVDV